MTKFWSPCGLIYTMQYILLLLFIEENICTMVYWKVKYDFSKEITLEHFFSSDKDAVERRLSHIQATQNYYPQFEISWWQCVYLHPGVCKIQWYNNKNKNSPTHGVKSLFNLFLTTKKRTRTDDDETVYLIIFKKKLQMFEGKKMLKKTWTVIPLLPIIINMMMKWLSVYGDR